MKLIQAQTPEQIDLARQLFREYEASLNIDLCFQNFENELAQLPGDYAPPHGDLLLAYQDDDLAGCVALRKISETVCEMKRLFVRDPFRGKRIGGALTQAIISEAKRIGYERMRLDTLPGKMDDAIILYRRLGFEEIAPYRHNPVPGAIFMELKLM